MTLPARGDSGEGRGPGRPQAARLKAEAPGHLPGPGREGPRPAVQEGSAASSLGLIHHLLPA